MTKNLLLVDYENVHKIDLSVLDDTYRAIIFVGASQNPPKVATKKATAHRFKRVDFQKIAGAGKNALDFHIAFHLGRTFETALDTACIVVSKDKGFDPLLLHLNQNGLKCRRVDSFEQLLPVAIPATTNPTSIDPAAVVCAKCKEQKTIEHLGARWCTNCGSFATEPDPKLLPSRQPGYQEPTVRRRDPVPGFFQSTRGNFECGWCNACSEMVGGIYDDGEWMCADCIDRCAR